MSDLHCPVPIELLKKVLYGRRYWIESV